MGTSLTSMSSIEVRKAIEAPPERVWGLISDPTQMGDLTVECTTMQWVGASSAPSVGARFRGSNRKGWRRWTTTCTIVRYEPGTEIAWDVRLGPVAVAEWSYRVEGTGEGQSVVTEGFVDHRSPSVRATGSLTRGVRDTDAHNRSNMEETLSRIKSRAEQ